MSNKVNSIIKLRSDTISNWLTNSTKVLNDRELSVIKYSDGTVGFKLGDGSTYANTPLLKFNSVITNNISDGTSTFTFPSSGGTLATIQSVFSKLLITRPNSNENLYLRLTLTTEDQMEGGDNDFIFEFDSAVSTFANKFKVYNKTQDKWDSVSASYLGSSYSGSLVLIDVQSLLSSSYILSGLDYNSRVYAYYTWYYVDDGDDVNLSTGSTVLNAVTESIPISEFNKVLSRCTELESKLNGISNISLPDLSLDSITEYVRSIHQVFHPDANVE